MQASGRGWFVREGVHATKLLGPVQRFRCLSCGRSFSTRTFSIDYYAKRRVDYRDLSARHAGAQSLRAMSRALGVSCGSVQNRLDRLARNALALHAGLRPLARPGEAVAVDGFVSFDVSQYFPSETTMSITAGSRFVLDLSHATRRRSGSMTAAQRTRADALYSRVRFERGAVSRSFGEVLGSLAAERAPARHRPLVIITDEKREYRQVLVRSPIWRDQDEERRVAHLTVNSRLPRTFRNPLFPSNYLDREIRKDQAAHRRETTCFGRNVANGLSRLACYLVEHNYRKRYLVKAPVGDLRTHAEAAGIGRERIDEALAGMYSRRAFLTRTSLSPTLERIWRKSSPTPLKAGKDYLPAFALA
jgi:transposase-like protein